MQPEPLQRARVQPERAAARLLNAAAATLAGGVLADSAAEHYRAGFFNPAMFAGPAVAAAAVTAAISAAVAPRPRADARDVVFALSTLAGAIGCGFHLRNVSRRPGGWSSANVFHGAPVAAPLALSLAGLLGLAAARAGRRTPHRLTAGPALGLLSAAGIVGTSAEAAALHFRGAFQNPFMFAPVILPPAAAIALATASARNTRRTRTRARVLLHLTGWLGIAGTGFHAWGIQRRMGGWHNWRQNYFAGPPLPAPPAFTGLALAGLAALMLLEKESER